MRESKEIEKDSCSVLTTHTTLHNKEKRKPIQIRMRRSVHDVVGNYINKTMSYGQFYEEAAILFMDINPKEFTPLVVEKPSRRNNIRDEMREFIYIDKMREFVERLNKDDPNNNARLLLRRERFVELLTDCNKIKIWGEELTALVMQARNHFD